MEDELFNAIKELTEEIKTTKALTQEIKEILRYIRSDLPTTTPKKYEITTSDHILERLK